ncbi:MULTISPECIES: DUF190 domain-containing protein [unclassified Mycobacterium]|uniref:DUF190 domain-containing protein n=1 Tax=Mycolicibacterium parafortuitum TaxID=39692 RepID=A0ACC6MF11_MYCPF|nr:DUF190 domain-containing protein [Mycolicibacterium parafortuitum]
MGQEILTLTAYFAERERHGGRFLAEELLDRYDQQSIATSVMLRGIASFGPAHVVRSDRSLSLSEDPPVTLTAVDSADRIIPLAEEVAGVVDRGVLTLERGRTLPDPASSDDVRLSVYLGRRQRVAGAAGYLRVCEVFHRLGFLSAEVFLGVDGTVSGERRRARFFSRNADVPLIVVGVGTAAQAEAALTELRPHLADPLITLERIVVCKNAGHLIAEPGRVPGGYLKVTVRTDEDSRHDGTPVHRALVSRLMQTDHANGATVLRSIWGYHGAQAPHGDQLFQLARHVPVSTVIVDTAESIAASYPVIDELTVTHGLVTCEAVPAMLALDHGRTQGGLLMQ